jgi:elongation factor 1-gamma
VSIDYLTSVLSLVPNQTLLGNTKEQYANIIQWMSFSTSHILHTACNVFYPLVGRSPYNKKVVDTATVSHEVEVAVLEAHLTENTYLVGERVTLADLYAATMFQRGFQFLYGIEWRKAHPAITRWYKTIIANPIFNGRFDDYEYRDEPVKYTPPKKEEKPKPAKKEEKPAAAAAPAAAEEEDETPKEKKAPHPLAALGPAKMVLDNWKRVYSNEDTRAKALPWFWENYDASEWSLYKVAYKYNDELTLTFMSNNLIGGFFNRLSASTKFLFGCQVVYGENNNNGIIGCFVVRGQDFAPAFDVAPDWESYEYTKLDPSKPEDKEFVEDLWAWDKPLVINGEKREVADGKVFK